MSDCKKCKELEAENTKLRADLEHQTEYRLEGLRRLAAASGATFSPPERCTDLDVVESAIQQLRARLAKLDRTLTLPNGTVVRAGEDWVTDRGYIWRITAIGERLAMGRIIERNDEPAKHDKETHEQLIDIACTLLPYKDRWRPWSEVHPDRPVPGEGIEDE